MAFFNSSRPMKIHRVPKFAVSFLAAACLSAHALDTASVEHTSLPKSVAPALLTVKPPREPKSNHFHISEAKLAQLPKPEQPQPLRDALLDLQNGSIEDRVEKLKAKAMADLVYVEGGSFMRGDFAKLMGVPGVTRMTYNEDDKVVREIKLSDFWISRYKTTYSEFDVFTDATKRPRTGMDSDGENRHPLVPAGAYWQEAKDYCLWLGKITGQRFDLPTEAQWEYAARSRGQFFMIATDDGNIEFGRNVPYAAQAEELSPLTKFVRRYPISLFPPNPLGLYDMTYGAMEWVNDWYASDAYAKTKSVDPKGPNAGDRKVTRGWDHDDLKIGVNVWRRKAKPIPTYSSFSEGREKDAEIGTSWAPSLRCVATPP
jgi:formylglycine-generating enzyme